METVRLIIKIEFILLFLSIALMFYVRIARHLSEKKTDARRHQIKQIFSEALQKGEVVKIDRIPQAARHFEDILPVVEVFDRTFLDPVWQATKKGLIDDYLMPEAMKTIHSPIWQKRQLALRVMALDPKQLLDEARVLHLLDDSKYLVRIVAASCLIKSEKKRLLLPVIERMCKESPLARYPYRDLLMNSGKEIFDSLREIALQSNNPEVTKVCLDVLSTKISPNLQPVVERHIASQDQGCRLASVKILGELSNSNLKDQLEECLGDESWEVRAEAAQSLGKKRALESIPSLNLSLNDSEWHVRLQAALALKAMGKEGWSVLHQQDNTSHPEAYEIARYVMALP